MRKKIIKKITYILSLLLFVFVFGIGNAEASANHTLQLTVPVYDDIIGQLDHQDGHVLEYWKLPDQDLFHDDLEAYCDNLNFLSAEELNATYEYASKPLIIQADHLEVNNLSPGFYYGRIQMETAENNYLLFFIFHIAPQMEVTELQIKSVLAPKENGQVKLIKTDEDQNVLRDAGFRLYAVDEQGKGEEVTLVGEYIYDSEGAVKTLYTDKQGEITVMHLPYGDYYFQEVEAPEGYILSEQKISFTLTDNTTLFLEVENEKAKVGGFRFIKISDDPAKSPLAGATFKVTRKVDGKDLTVENENGPILLTSDADGLFSVNNLPYGTYQLWETNAPQGYIALKNALTFEIDGSDSSRILEIVNRKEPPIRVPNTGDLAFVVIMSFSLILFLAGFKLSREQKKGLGTGDKEL